MGSAFPDGASPAPSKMHSPGTGQANAAKEDAMGKGSSGGKGASGGSKGAGYPSTTGKPSGGGRDNGPRK